MSANASAARLARSTYDARWGLAALLCGAGAFVVWALAFHGGPFERADARLLLELYEREHRVDELAHAIGSLCDPVPWTLFLVVTAVAGVLAGRARDTLTGVAAAVGATVSSQLLKPLLAAPRGGDVAGLHVSDAAWPSGHTTAAAALAIAVVLAAPPHRRPLAAGLGLLFTAAVGGSVVVLGWHYPRDVAGGALLAGAWACALLGLRYSGQP